MEKMKHFNLALWGICLEVKISRTYFDYFSISKPQCCDEVGFYILPNSKYVLYVNCKYLVFKILLNIGTFLYTIWI